METAPHPKAELLQEGQVRVQSHSHYQSLHTQSPAPTSQGAVPPASPQVQAHLGAIAAILHLQIQKKFNEAWLSLYCNREEFQDHDFDAHVLNLAPQSGQESVSNGSRIIAQAGIH